MTDAENRVRDAFEALEVPPGLNERTLELIEGKRALDADSLPHAEKRAGARAAAPRRSRGFRAAVAAIAAAACLALAFVGAGLLERDPAGAPDADAQLDRLSRELAEKAAQDWPTAYIAIDVNPSIELAVRSDDTVREAFGLNEDGALILEGMRAAGEGLEGLPVGEAIASLMESEGFAPYLTADSYVALSVTCEDEEQRQRLMDVGGKRIAELPCKGRCQAVDPAEREAAIEAGMGVQRYRAAQELMALDEELTWEECAQMSMRELRDRIAAIEAAG